MKGFSVQMAALQVKMPQKLKDEINEHCRKESVKRGEFYSANQFIRDAAKEKLEKAKR